MKDPQKYAELLSKIADDLTVKVAGFFGLPNPLTSKLTDKQAEMLLTETMAAVVQIVRSHPLFSLSPELAAIVLQKLTGFAQQTHGVTVNGLVQKEN